MRILNGTSSVSLQSTRYLSDALIELGYEADILVYKPNSLLVGYEDININIDTKKYLKYPFYILKIMITFLKSTFKYQVFHFHFGRSFFPYNLDLIVLYLLGKRVYMEYHGSEIRRRSVFERMNNSLESFSGVDDDVSYKLQKRVSRFINGIIVHDHELMENLYNFNKPVHLLPLRIDIRKFTPKYPESRDEIIIVHAPSKRKTKGSQYILKAINNLSSKYRIKFTLIEGVPNSELKKLIMESDIVIDQLIIGSYGMYSIESMAMGKPTVCYLRDDLIEKFPEVPPIYNANIYNIEERLEELITDYSLRYNLGKKGRKYVEEYHDSRKIAKRALNIYENIKD